MTPGKAHDDPENRKAEKTGGPTIIIEGGTLVDGTGGPPLTGARIVVRDGRVVSVEGPAPEGEERPTGRQDTGSPGTRPPATEAAGDDVVRIDARGRTVLPGLIDCHVHIMGDGNPDILRAIRKTTPRYALEAAVHARRTLEAGFTTIRDAGATALIDLALRDAIRDDLVPGPRMLVSGVPLTTTGGHGDPFWPPEITFRDRSVVDSPDEARKAAREQLRCGADVIKLCATGGVMTELSVPTARGMTVAEMRAAIEEAHNLGRKTLAHAHGAEGVKNAILAGIDSVEHGSYLTDEIIELMLERGVFLVPTLVAVHRIVINADKAGMPEWAVSKAREHTESHRASFRRALAAGVKIAMGTDAATPFNYHGENALELELMVNEGMSPGEAILSATSRAAELLGLSDLVGTVAPGKLADIVVVAGDPLADITCLQDKSRIEVVLKDGRIAVDRRSAGGFSPGG